MMAGVYSDCAVWHVPQRPRWCLHEVPHGFLSVSDIMAYLKPENYATLEIQGTESLPVLERASAQKWKPVLALGVLVAVSVAAYNAIVPQSAPTTSLAMRPMQQVRYCCVLLAQGQAGA